MRYPELTTHAKNWFDGEFQELFASLDEIEDGLANAKRDGNPDKITRYRARRVAVKRRIDELDRVLLGVFNSYREWHPDEFFPEIDRYDILPMREPELDPTPSDETLANSWQDDRIFSYRTER